jgi:hypothetical protein
MLATTTPGVILGFKASAAADPGQDFIGAGVREVENDISLDGVSIRVRTRAGEDTADVCN